MCVWYACVRWEDSSNMHCEDSLYTNDSIIWQRTVLLRMVFPTTESSDWKNTNISAGVRTENCVSIYSSRSRILTNKILAWLWVSLSLSHRESHARQKVFPLVVQKNCCRLCGTRNHNNTFRILLQEPSSTLYIS